MALAEATVRVVLDVTKFENDLQQRVERAARAAGREFDKSLRKHLAEAGKGAAEQFRDSTRTAMGRAGVNAAEAFDNSFRRNIARRAGAIAQSFSRPLRVAVGRAGIDAGSRFCDNFTRVVQQCGRIAGRAMGQTLQNTLINTLTSGTTTQQALTKTTSAASRKAGRQAGRQFALSFDVGIGSARVGRGLGIALASLTAQLVTDLGPVGSVLAPVPALFGAITAGALVTVSAFRGVGTALKAIGDADIEKLSEAMHQLAPQAQGVVREFAAMRPALASVRTSIQDAFFGQLQGQVTNLITALSGPLRGGLVDVATSAGILGRSLSEAFTGVRGVDNINGLLRGTSGFLRQLAPGFENLTRGMLDFIAASAPGLNTIGNAFQNLLTRMGNFLTRAAESGDALVWTQTALAGIQRLGQTLGQLVDIFQILTAAARPLLSLMSEIFGIVTTLARAFGSLPGPVQTLAVAFLLLRRTGVLEFFQRNIPTAVRGAETAITKTAGAVRQAGAAFTTAATPVRTFQQSLQGPFLQQAPTVLGRIRDSLAGVATVAATTGASITAGFGGALKSAGASLKNFGSAVIGAFGGGIAFGITAGITLLVTTLGLLAGGQARAAQRAAEHQAAIARLTDTLNRQSGAVTQATRDLVAKQLAENGSIRSAQQLGVAADDLVDASLGEADALAKVNVQLLDSLANNADNADAFRRSAAELQRHGVSAKDITAALLGNSDAFGRVSAAAQKAGVNMNDFRGAEIDADSAAVKLLQQIGILNSDLGEAADQAAAAADAMTPAALAAQRYADAVGVLGDKMATAEDKAAALNEILRILAGGTTDVELAQAKFTETLQGLDEQLAGLAEDAAASGKQIEGFATGVVDATGRINASTQAGALLLDTFDQLTQGISTTTGAAKSYAEQTGDVAGATQRVAAEAQRARDQFIQTAIALGLNQGEAEKLADAYGLIPELVATTITTEGSAEQTKLQVAAVGQQLQNLPLNTPVKVQALTREAIEALKAVGLEVTRLPDGTLQVTAKTEEARTGIASVLQQLRSLPPNTPVRVQGLTQQAIDALRAVGIQVQAIPGSKDVTITATDRATAIINRIKAALGGFGKPFFGLFGAGGGILPKARGGIVGMRDGGIHGAGRPGSLGARMSARRAEIVPPDTWRVIGDRRINDEAFIPINKSARATQILAETARRMQFGLVPLDRAARRGSGSDGRSVTVEAGAIQVNAPFADPQLVARATVNELARQSVG